jgi:hypothetical protein
VADERHQVKRGQQDKSEMECGCLLVVNFLERDARAEFVWRLWASGQAVARAARHYKYREPVGRARSITIAPRCCGIAPPDSAAFCKNTHQKKPRTQQPEKSLKQQQEYK